MRYGLLLTAVATVAAPGLLAVLGVVGHGQAVAPPEVESAEIAGSALSGPFPVAAATARTAVRDDLAAAQRASGTPLTVLSRMTAGQQAAGLRLLGQAADAGRTASFTGTERLSQTGVDGRVAMTSRVSHLGAGTTLVQTADGAAPPAVSSVSSVSSAAASGSPEGVFGVTSALVRLLSRHYVAAYAGRGSVAGRPAAVVELYRYDGSLAARYWLDRQTMVPLRREVLDTAEHVVSEDSFVQVRFGAAASVPLAGTGTGPGTGTGTGTAGTAAWTAAAVPAGFAASLAAQGWPAPGAVGGLPLYAAATTRTAAGEVADLEYSDGLYDVSLFVQRGTLASRLAGWQPVRVAGRPAFASGHSVTWASSGFVYTVIADAPPQMVTQVVGALPASGPPGLLGRLGRGFARLARMTRSI